MTLIGSNDSANLTDVFHGILEQYKVHDCIHIVVFSKSLVKSLGHSIGSWELVIQFIIQRTHELSKDKWFWSGTEVLLQVEFRECL